MTGQIGPADAAWFLFTDVEDSTRLWDRDAGAMHPALARHDELVTGAVAEAGGRAVKHTGDGLLAVFSSPAAALTGAIGAQQRLHRERWATVDALLVRMGVHGGPADEPDSGWFERAGDFFGPTVHRCARVMSAAHGGQVICSAAVIEALDGTAPPDLDLRDLGVHELRGFARPEGLYQVSHADLPEEFPPLRTVSAILGNLPTAADEFIGREREIDEVAARLRRARLVTLVGVGGVGKTRLGLRVADTVAEQFPDGAWFVPLAPIADPTLLGSTVARTLGVRERSGEPIERTLAEVLAARCLLLVLDSCEHLVDGAAALTAELLATGGGSRVLATSREALGLVAEQAWPVPVLDVPRPGAPLEEVRSSSAVRLFVERARASDPGFVLDRAIAEDVAELCRRLDGVPLALELAAGRLDAMSPAEIVGRLDRRFRLLAGRRAGEERHGTLRAAIDWSHELLGPDEQALFRRLCVFSGGFDVDAAEQVTAGGLVEELAVADLLARLVRKSMVAVQRVDGRSRYRQLETLREYARERLDAAAEAEAFADAHAQHFAGLVASLDADLRGPGQSRAYEVLLRELDNVRAAFDRLVSVGDGEAALRMVRSLRTFWTELMPTEGRRRARAALDAAVSAPAAARAGGLADASWIGWMSGEAGAPALATASVALSQDAGLLPDPEALFTLGLAALFDRRAREAMEHFLHGASVARVQEDDYEVASALTGSSFVRAMLGDPPGAVADGEEALAIGRRLGYDTQIAAALGALGFAYGATDPRRAVELFEESLRIKADTTYSAMARVIAGHLCVVLGEAERARQLLVEALRHADAMRDTTVLPTALEGLAGALSLAGEAERGARVLGVADTTRAELHLPGLEIEQDLRTLAETIVGGALDAQTFAAARAEGRALPLADGLAEASTIPTDP